MLMSGGFGLKSIGVISMQLDAYTSKTSVIIISSRLKG